MNVKGVIVAAGYGSRFLPATKTVPKEMLPLIDRPAISFIVDEFIDSGIEEILIITSRRKKSLDDYFDRETELEAVFEREGKQAALEKIRPPRAQIFFTRQQEMKGTGHAILQARGFTGDHPFIVAYPDDLVFSEKPLSRQLIDAWRETDCSVLAVKDLAGQDVSRYGVVAPTEDRNPCHIRELVEKPAPGEEPSTLVSYGRYLFTSELYDYLEQGLAHHEGGEFYHVGAINDLARAGKMVALDFEGNRLDTGAPAGFLEAICRYALTRDDLSSFAKNLFRELSS